MKAWYHVTIWGKNCGLGISSQEIEITWFLNVFEGQLKPKKLLEKINQ